MSLSCQAKTSSKIEKLKNARREKLRERERERKIQHVREITEYEKELEKTFDI